MAEEGRGRESEEDEDKGRIYVHEKLHHIITSTLLMGLIPALLGMQFLISSFTKETVQCRVKTFVLVQVVRS
jgi:hypothetical protein